MTGGLGKRGLKRSPFRDANGALRGGREGIESTRSTTNESVLMKGITNGH